MSEERICGFCGHAMTFDRCGLAGDSRGRETVWLCHADDHDCYHRWTAYGDRPAGVAEFDASLERLGLYISDKGSA